MRGEIDVPTNRSRAIARLVVGRLREPSTWMGLGSLFTALGWQVAPEFWNYIGLIGMGIGGLMAIALAEN